MKLARGRGASAVIPLTPLVDVMLILLVFFMVTSTYLDLDMIPVGPGGEAGQAAGPSEAGGGTDAGSATVLLRIDVGGRVIFRGEALSSKALGERLAGTARVLILPSGSARAQDLVGTMEAVARAGVTDVRIVRLEAWQ